MDQDKIKADYEVHCILEGSVQGVGLRYWIFQEASKNSWKGFVRNLPNGHVELVVQGVTEEEVLKLAHHAESPATMQRATAVTRPSKERYSSFQILR